MTTSIRLAQEIGAAGRPTGYTRDGNGNNHSVTDPLTTCTQYSYDAVNRLATQTMPQRHDEFELRYARRT